LAKFHSSGIQLVADLPEGKLPSLLVSKYVGDGVEYVSAQSVASVEFAPSGLDTVVMIGNESLYLTDDWTLLGSEGLA